MRVLMVITGLDVGGAETSLEAIVRAMEEMGHSVKVVSLKRLGPVGERMVEAGRDVIALNMTGAASIPRAIWRLRGIMRGWQPDVIHSWMYHADLVAGLAARLAGQRNLVWSLHASNISKGMLAPTTRKLICMLAPLSRVLPERIIATSEASRDIHGAAGYDLGRIIVLPNGVDTARFVPDPEAAAGLRKELDLAAGTRLVGLIARYDVQKNHVGFFEAAAYVRARHADAHFVLAGKDITPDHPVLAAAIARHDLGAVVSLLGLRDDIPRLAAALDVVAMPSDGESFPLILIEAMAAGAVPAVTDVGAMAHIVGDTGRVSAVGEMGALGAAIADLLDAPPETLAAARTAARTRVIDEFSIEKVACAYLANYPTRTPRF